MTNSRGMSAEHDRRARARGDAGAASAGCRTRSAARRRREWAQDAIGAAGNRTHRRLARARRRARRDRRRRGAPHDGARRARHRRRGARGRRRRRASGRVARSRVACTTCCRRADVVVIAAPHTARDARPHRPARAGADDARRDPRQRQPRAARRRGRAHRRAARGRDRAAPRSTCSTTSRCRPRVRSGRCRTCSSRRTRPASAPITGTPATDSLRREPPPLRRGAAARQRRRQEGGILRSSGSGHAFETAEAAKTSSHCSDHRELRDLGTVIHRRSGSL